MRYAPNAKQSPYMDAGEKRPPLHIIRNKLVRDAHRSFWQRLADWLNEPVSLGRKR
jgi:hypothetical protein